MSIVKAYYKLNIIMLMKEPIPLIWSVALPAIFLFINLGVIQSESDLSFFWSYIILSTYIIGVGVHAVRLRESGSLKTYFSIKESRFPFFYATVLFQITFNFISITIINILATFLIGLHFLDLFIMSSILIILALPLCYFSFLFTLFKNISVNTLSTIVSIILFLSLILMPSNHVVNQVNPLYLLSSLASVQSFEVYVYYFIMSVVLITVGLFSIKKYSVFSDERR